MRGSRQFVVEYFCHFMMIFNIYYVYLIEINYKYAEGKKKLLKYY